MKFEVNQELCTGCGSCMETCCVGAIHVQEAWAVIDQTLCTQCEACVTACPQGAIVAVLEPERTTAIVSQSLSALGQDPGFLQISPPVKASRQNKIIPWAGAALAYLGREIVPPLIDVLASSLQQRLVASETNALTSSPDQSNPVHKTESRIRRQTRYRGGQKKMRHRQNNHG